MDTRENSLRPAAAEGGVHPTPTATRDTCPVNNGAGTPPPPRARRCQNWRCNTVLNRPRAPWTPEDPSSYLACPLTA